jgi:NADPH:quinone reductase-like Zn-dependent oxidoreductase
MRAAVEPMPATAGVETMKAIVQDEYGSAPEGVLRLAEVSRPTIGDDEILVHVRAASVDRGTWHLMAGLPYPMRVMGFGLRRPKAPNPGRSTAGTVESVGKNVTEFKPGDEVYGTCDGSFAEYARARAGLLAPKPANLSFEQAAAVPVSGLAALQAVRDKAQVQTGEKVLIVGASGGVGTFAVQIAKAFGAEVTGVCSTGKTDLVRALGADHVIDYTIEDSPTANTATTRSSTSEATARCRSSVEPSPPAGGSLSSEARPMGVGSAAPTACSGRHCCRRS